MHVHKQWDESETHTRSWKIIPYCWWTEFLFFWNWLWYRRSVNSNGSPFEVMKCLRVNNSNSSFFNPVTEMKTSTISQQLFSESFRSNYSSTNSSNKYVSEWKILPFWMKIAKVLSVYKKGSVNKYNNL